MKNDFIFENYLQTIFFAILHISCEFVYHKIEYYVNKDEPSEFNHNPLFNYLQHDIFL